MIAGESAFTTEATQELQEEMVIRSRLNPDYAKRVGNFGFIEMESCWGDEATILNTARVSTSNLRIDQVADFTQKDRDLLYHLLRNNHGTPFETVVFRWRVIAPIFVFRQWMRHRICSFNEFSQRYRQPVSAYYVPNAEACTVGNLQVITPAQIERYAELMENLHQFYQKEYQVACQRIDEAEARGAIPKLEGGRNPYRGRAREILRNAMPLSCYSDLYWTINFRSLMNFFELRRSPEAQYEIRQFADAAYAMFKRKLPILGEAMDRVLRGRTTL
jgi:thymidylate synthase (FAD)